MTDASALRVTNAGTAPPTIVVPETGEPLRDMCRALVDAMPAAGLPELLLFAEECMEFYVDTGGPWTEDDYERAMARVAEYRELLDGNTD